MCFISFLIEALCEMFCATLVSLFFGDTVAEQVARNISQCNIPCNGQNRFETSCKSRAESSSTFRATCLATILAAAGYVTM